MKEEIIKLIKIIFRLIVKEGSAILALFLESLKKDPFFCNDVRIIYDSFILILWLFLVSSIIWILYEIFNNIYL